MEIIKPAVFLDRDGVLTKERGYVCSVECLEIFPYTETCIKQIHEKGYYAIVITNQSGVARGLFTEEILQKMNEYLTSRTGIDAIYYCPHHPKGIVRAYRRECSCRKPGVGLFAKACEDFGIDMNRSYMIGDRAGDILAGQNAGLKTILLESGYGSGRLEEQVTSDYIMRDLTECIPLL